MPVREHTCQSNTAAHTCRKAKCSSSPTDELSYSAMTKSQISICPCDRPYPYSFAISHRPFLPQWEIWRYQGSRRGLRISVWQCIWNNNTLTECGEDSNNNCGKTLNDLRHDREWMLIYLAEQDACLQISMTSPLSHLLHPWKISRRQANPKRHLFKAM